MVKHAINDEKSITLTVYFDDLPRRDYVIDPYSRSHFILSNKNNILQTFFLELEFNMKNEVIGYHRAGEMNVVDCKRITYGKIEETV